MVEMHCSVMLMQPGKEAEPCPNTPRLNVAFRDSPYQTVLCRPHARTWLPHMRNPPRHSWDAYHPIRSVELLHG